MADSRRHSRFARQFVCCRKPRLGQVILPGTGSYSSLVKQRSAWSIALGPLARYSHLWGYSGKNSPAQLADFLEEDTPKANRLRQSSPFLGVLEQIEGRIKTPHAT